MSTTFIGICIACPLIRKGPKPSNFDKGQKNKRFEQTFVYVERIPKNTFSLNRNIREKHGESFIVTPSILNVPFHLIIKNKFPYRAFYASFLNKKLRYMEL
jgi:hypothetical protein